jgi:hypothetical protein
VPTTVVAVWNLHPKNAGEVDYGMWRKTTDILANIFRAIVSIFNAEFFDFSSRFNHTDNAKTTNG